MTKDSQGAREAIVRAAFALFGERGVHQINVSEICKRAGVSRAAFYLHFKNRDEIIAHGMREMLESFWAKIGADDAKNDVVTTVQQYLAALVTSPFLVHGSSFRLILELCAHSSLVRDEYASLLAAIRKRIRDQLVLGQRSGMVRNDVDALHLASLLVGAAYGAIVTIEITTGRPEAPGFDAQAVAGTIAQLLRGPGTLPDGS